MSKNIRRIVIASAAVVVLALAFVLLKYVFPEKEIIIEETPAPTEEPVYYLVRKSGNEVSGYTFRYSDGTEFAVQAQPNDNGSYTFTATPEDSFFGYNTSRLRSMMFTISSISATSKIEENPKDLSDYGLDDPQFVLTVNFDDGSSTTVYVGNETPVKNYYYANTDKDDTVYTIGNYLTSLMTRQPYEYLAIDYFPTYEDNDIYENIVRFILTRRDGVSIEVVLDKDLSMEGNITSSAYMMVQPFVSPCTSETVEDLLDVLATLSVEKIAGNIYPEDDLHEYGLDNPARLYLEDAFGNSVDLVIGIANEGKCVAAIARQYEAFMAGETDYLTIIFYTETDFDWINLNYMNLQIRTPWVISIHDVDAVIYDLDGETYEMLLYEYDDVTGSGVEVVRTCSHINGKDIGETNTKRIYSRTLNFRQVQSVAPDVKYEEAFSSSITIRMKDGSERFMSFHKINERQYACMLDGNVEYYIYASNLATLRSALERAMDDREVPLVYER
jgi:hypothetical protein